MNPNLEKVPAEMQNFYNKIVKKIKKNGHTILGTVDGKGNLKRPFAYTIGASYKVGAEFLSFFPIKGKGITTISKIMDRIIELIQKGDMNLKSQIIKEANVYSLPIAMLVLDNEIKKMVESTWPQQLQRDAFLSEFSTDDHQLVTLIASDKNGNLPWEPMCGSYWPEICPKPLVATAQEIFSGNNSLMEDLEKELGIGETEKELGIAQYKKSISELDSKYPSQKIDGLFVSGKKSIENKDYNLAVDIFTELIYLFGWEDWSKEEKLIFEACNVVWSKQGDDRLFILFWSYFFRAQAEHELKQYEHSILDFSKAIDLGLDMIEYDPNEEFSVASPRSWTIYAYNGRGIANRLLNNLAKAMSDFDLAIELCKDDDNHHKNQIFYNIGLTKKDMEDHEGAVNAFSLAIEIVPDNVDAYYWRGLSRYNMEEHDFAIDDFSYVINNFQNVENLDFDLKLAYLYRCKIRLHINDIDGSERDYQRYKKLEK